MSPYFYLYLSSFFYLKTRLKSQKAEKKSEADAKAEADADYEDISDDASDISSDIAPDYQDSIWEKKAKRIEFFPKDPWCMNQEELEKHHPMSGAGCSVM